jgi:hypothetical protein
VVPDRNWADKLVGKVVRANFFLLRDFRRLVQDEVEIRYLLRDGEENPRRKEYVTSIMQDCMDNGISWAYRFADEPIRRAYDSQRCLVEQLLNRAQAAGYLERKMEAPEFLEAKLV